MTTLRDIIDNSVHQEYSTAAGSRTQRLLQHINIDAPRDADAALCAHIKSMPHLAKFFGPNSRAEVPVAGTVRGRFISRRIDRMVIDDASRRVQILDYKTDVNRDERRAEYANQITEYVMLLRQIYPDYDVRGYILWLHDWTCEEIIVR